MEFQVIDWQEDDIKHDPEYVKIGEDEYGESITERRVPREVVFRAYGRTTDGHSVCARIRGFEPYFYLKVPMGLDPDDAVEVIHQIMCSDEFRDNNKNLLFGPFWTQYVSDIEIVELKELYWFSNDQLRPFLKLSFTSVRAYNRGKRLFENEKVKAKIKFVDGKIRVWRPRKFLYESNLSPLLRFFHCYGIQPAGWIKVKGRPTYDKETYAKYEFDCHTSDIKAISKTDMAPFIICSYDIECTSGDGSFPQPERPEDETIQIGCTFHRYGEKQCFEKWIIVIGESDPIPEATVVSVKDERQLLLKWAEKMRTMDIDILTGYNIWGFDFRYVFERALNGCGGRFPDFSGQFLTYLSKHKINHARFIEKDLSSSALGKNILYYVEGEGIVGIDLYKVVMRDHKLGSYKLDNVSSTFIRSSVKRVELMEGGYAKIKTPSLDYLQDNTWISFQCYFNREDKKLLREHEKKGFDKKYRIVEACDGEIIIENFSIDECLVSVDQKERWMSGKIKCEWYQNKVDLSPAGLFEAYRRSTPKDIQEIAIYCLKDCELVSFLVMKLEVIANNIGMANVCIVPFSYLFVRGQGVKIFSLVAEKCAREEYVVPVVRSEDADAGTYEGAIVFDPVPGIYFEPVSVMDYASLYPSSMIAENISHETLVLVRDYDLDGKLVEERGNPELLDLEGYQYNEIDYDNYSGIGDEKTKCGIRKCIYAERTDGVKGLMPRILEHLLFARRATRASANYWFVILKDGTEIEGFYKNLGDGNHQFQKYKESAVIIDEKDFAEGSLPKEKYNDFQKAILDGLQLAYKITCNSLYGQLGATTSPICMKELAASTTAVGRDMVIKARDYTLEKYPGSRLVYGDTDSVFISFKDYIARVYGADKVRDDNWEEFLKLSIKCGQEAGDYVSSRLKRPQELEYEKTFYPFVIFSKKRYFGNKYEFDPKKFKQTSMGIVLKRRDNAPIVKDIYQGVIDIILKTQNLEKAKDFFREQVANLMEGRVDIKDLIISKTLMDGYADPTTIAHNVLAQRMGKRDPGSKPQVNDRIPYCFISADNYTCSIKGCNKKIDEKKCKCRVCQCLYCPGHLNKHSDYCEPVCRFTGLREGDLELGDELQKCVICGACYCKKSFVQHMTRNDRKKGVIKMDKCKHLLDQKLLQGDLVEHPEYILENKLKIDYRYYYERQVMKPVMQIFELTMTPKNASKIVEDIIRKDDLKKKGIRDISSYFKF